MTDLETRLDKALKADAPAARDPMFRIAVMARREQAALRRRLVVAIATAFGVAILAAVGAEILGLLPGDERLGASAVAGALLAAMLAAPWLGGTAALRGLMGRTSQAVRAMPGLRLWR